jgi:hypothetical protein
MKIAGSRSTCHPRIRIRIHANMTWIRNTVVSLPAEVEREKRDSKMMTASKRRSLRLSILAFTAPLLYRRITSTLFPALDQVGRGQHFLQIWKTPEQQWLNIRENLCSGTYIIISFFQFLVFCFYQFF